MCYVGFGGLWMAMLWGALIGVIVWAIVRFSRQNGSGSTVNHIEIAKERYAKGEISKEEFEQIKKDLA